MSKHEGVHKQPYSGEYAKMYIERTLSAPYTVYKSRLLAGVISGMGAHTVIDLGSNVHGSVREECSLRHQLESKGINYFGVDLSQSYFAPEFLREHGVVDSKIFPERKGVVGDLLRSPIKSNSAEAITCNDVAEHVSDPAKAIHEMARILKPDGTALVILPSLYKLDTADFKHIAEKRVSSHLEKTTVDGWVRLCEDNNLVLDEQKSIAFGIASGLSYLTWIDEQFVPERKSLGGSEIHSPESTLNRNAKAILARYDEAVDARIRADNTKGVLVSALQAGNTEAVFQLLDSLTTSVVRGDEKNLLHEFFEKARTTQYAPERVAIVQKVFSESRFPELLLGNSVLLAFNKKYEDTSSWISEENQVTLSKTLLDAALADGIERQSVSLIVRNQENAVLMLKRATAGRFSGFYDLPGGGLEANEDIFSALGRELYEETGMAVKAFTAHLESLDFRDSQDLRCRRHLFSGLTEDFDVFLNGQEHSDYTWVHSDDLDRLPMLPEVRAALKKLFRGEKR